MRWTTLGAAGQPAHPVVLCPQPYGVRIRAFSDPVGNLIRVREKR